MKLDHPGDAFTTVPADKHNWELLGGAAGWEIWGCWKCGVERYPSVFGSLWRFRWWRNRCPAAPSFGLEVEGDA